MRIALVNISLDPARGSDLVTISLAERLAQKDAVTVFSVRKTDHSAVAFHVRAPASRSVASLLKFLWSLPRELRDFDVINSHHAVLSVILPKKRLVTTYHGFRGRLNLRLGPVIGEGVSRLVRRMIIRPALVSSRSVVLVSQSLRSEIGPRQARNLRVIYNGVDAPAAHPPTCSPEHFIYVGRLDPDKNPRQLLTAYRAAGDLPPLLVAGDGSERAQLEAEFACDRIRFLGRVGRDELDGLYARAYAFITASSFETFCLPVIEAAHHGCPSIGWRSGSLPEVIQAGATGWLLDDFKNDAAVALHAAANMSAKDRATMSARCRNWARQFSWDAAIRQYAELYSEII